MKLSDVFWTVVFCVGLGVVFISSMNLMAGGPMISWSFKSIAGAAGFLWCLGSLRQISTRTTGIFMEDKR